MTRSLPRSLDPLADESLPGYLLRLAHRLDLSPARLEQVTGLAGAQQRARAGSMLTLAPEKAAAFANATRMTSGEVAAMTLDSLRTRYPPVDPVRAGRPGRRERRLVHGLFVRENWVFARFSRYCPQCLAGNGSVIQQSHGGGWSKLWRLPLVFACPTHDRVLEHACPVCGQPALSRGSGAPMLPRGSDSTLHPAACRASAHLGSDRKPSGACGHRLDQVTRTAQSHDLTTLLRLQNRLLPLLHHGDASTVSVGEPATPGQYVIDLRILTCLVSASWPHGRDFAANPHHAALIDQHVDPIRRQIAEDRRRDRLRRDNALYDRPPADAATGAALLAAAAAITTAGDPDTVREIVAPLLEAEPATRPWAKQFLLGDGHCSPGLQTALGPEVGALHVIKRTGVPHYATRRRTPPLRPVRFGAQHIPQRPPEQWIHDYFYDFVDLKQRLLEHFLVIRLAHTTLGGTAIDAAIQLGIPRLAADNAIRVINRALASSARHTSFDQAVGTLVEHLDAATDPVNYGRRRDALRDWQISPNEWLELIDGLPGQLVKNRLVPHTHWGDGKRRLASTWAWTQVTHGDHIYAPAVRPDPQAPRPGGDDVHYVHTRWWHLLRPSPYGHFRQLRDRLDPFIRNLAQHIDDAQV
jgi:hypothetical protein